MPWYNIYTFDPVLELLRCISQIASTVISYIVISCGRLTYSSPVSDCSCRNKVPLETALHMYAKRSINSRLETLIHFNMKSSYSYSINPWYISAKSSFSLWRILWQSPSRYLTFQRTVAFCQNHSSSVSTQLQITNKFIKLCIKGIVHPKI